MKNSTELRKHVVFLPSEESPMQTDPTPGPIPTCIVSCGPGFCSVLTGSEVRGHNDPSVLITGSVDGWHLPWGNKNELVKDLSWQMPTIRAIPVDMFLIIRNKCVFPLLDLLRQFLTGDLELKMWLNKKELEKAVETDAEGSLVTVYVISVLSMSENNQPVNDKR